MEDIPFDRGIHGKMTGISASICLLTLAGDCWLIHLVLLLSHTGQWTLILHTRRSVHGKIFRHDIISGADNSQTVPIYAVAFLGVAVSGYFMDRFMHYRGLVIACWLCLSLVCSIAVCTVYNFHARYVLIVFQATGLWSANALALSFASSTFGGMAPETRGVSLALVNALGNLASIYGSYLFPSSSAPKYPMGFGVISGMCFLGICVYLTAHIFIRRYPIKTY